MHRGSAPRQPVHELVGCLFEAADGSCNAERDDRGVDPWRFWYVKVQRGQLGRDGST